MLPLVTFRCFAERQRAAGWGGRQSTGSDDDPGGASGGNVLTGRVKAPVNADRRPIQKARDRFPGAG
jgi:hypothetical protein